MDQQRQLSQYGAGLFWDQADPQAGPGTSLYARSFSFFDGRYPDGFYWGCLTSANYRQRGNETSLDDHLLTLGWWGSPFHGFPLSLNVNAAPVLGSRSEGNVFLGSQYWGIGATAGVFLDIVPGYSLGISWEPVWILSHGNGRPAPDETDHEVVLSLVIKQLFWQ